MISIDSVVLYLEEAIEAVRAEAERGGEIRRNPVGFDMFGREAAMACGRPMYMYTCRLRGNDGVLFVLCTRNETGIRY